MLPSARPRRRSDSCSAWEAWARFSTWPRSLGWFRSARANACRLRLRYLQRRRSCAAPARSISSPCRRRANLRALGRARARGWGCEWTLILKPEPLGLGVGQVVFAPDSTNMYFKRVTAISGLRVTFESALGGNGLQLERAYVSRARMVRVAQYVAVPGAA